MGVGQGSALLPILSALYLFSFLKIFQKCLKNLKEKIPTDILSFVDNGLLVSQEKSFDLSSAYLTCSYNIISNIFKDAGLTERGKRGFDCDKQSEERSGSSSQSCTKGSEERITERDDRKD